MYEVTKQVKPSRYYYGVESEVFCKLTYCEALKYKAKLAKKLLEELSEEYFELIENNFFDGRLSDLQDRINDIKKAYEFNMQLLNECKGNCNE